VVEGYKGGADIDLAVEQGELNGRWTSYTALTAAKPHYIEKGLVTIIAQFGPKIERHSDAPNVKTLVSGDDRAVVRFMELSESVGLGLWVRPEVPKDRVQILRTAMNAATSDPAVRAEGAERGAPFEPLTGEEIETLVKEAYDLTPAQLTRLREVFGAR
jgi:tripartite-type tricarboxylate transporter receptor subunit TctC